MKSGGDPPEVRVLKNSISSADALLLATPEYNGGIAAVLKNAIDWASRSREGYRESSIYGKTVAVMGGGGGGVARAQEQLVQVLGVLGVDIVGPQLAVWGGLRNVDHVHAVAATNGSLGRPEGGLVNTVKDVVNVTIRAARIDDHRALNEVYSCPGVARGTLHLPYVSLDYSRKRLEEMPDGSYSLVAELDGRVVGSIGLHCGKNRMRHVGHIGMGVHDDFQNRGIGTVLLDAALDLAKNWLNLKRVELSVYTDNTPAIHLYKKSGFVIEGTHRAFAFRDGEFVDAYSMAHIRE